LSDFLAEVSSTSSSFPIVPGPFFYAARGKSCSALLQKNSESEVTKFAARSENTHTHIHATSFSLFVF
jgi:hypothetical protein